MCAVRELREDVRSCTRGSGDELGGAVDSVDGHFHGSRVDAAAASICVRNSKIVRRFADIASADGRFDLGAGRNCVDRESLRRGWRLVARTIEERDVDRVPALRERLCG